MIGIAEMFAELDGYTRYDVAIEEWGAWSMHARLDPDRRKRATELAMAWRKANPDKARQQCRSYKKRHADRVRTKGGAS